MKRACHHMPYGATLMPQGGVAFRLWAPAPLPIELLVYQADGSEQAIPCPPDALGWREAIVPGAAPGTRYHWQVHGPSGPVRVPDPASRWNPEGVDGPSEVVDPQRFRWDDDWRGRPWSEAVLYELHVGTFTPEGTYAAAEAHLADLAEDGITCIQLMPLAAFPGRFGWGYDGVLPFAPHAPYGSPDELKAFVRAAHRLGLMVMLDVVYNHFGPQGNHLSLYAPAFFTDRHQTPWGAGPNFDGPESAAVRGFFLHNALYWLEEYQLDGLRFDAVHAILDDSSPDIMETISIRARAACAGRHVHLVLENDHNDARRLAAAGTAGRFDAQWSGDAHHALHVWLTGEREGYYAEYADATLSMLAQSLSQGFAMVGAPHLADEAQQADNPRRRATESVPLPCTVNFLLNHDQIGNRAHGERLHALVDEAPMRLAVAMLILSPSPPLLFMGEERGARTPFLYFADWQGELRDAVVAGRRREFAHFSAFRDEAARAGIPDPCDEATWRRCQLDWSEADSEPARRWRAWYRALLTVRHDALHPALHRLARAGHSGDVIDGRALDIRWRFESAFGIPAGWLQMQVNLSAQALALDLEESTSDIARVTPLFDVGDVSPAQLGPWSGRWRWLPVD